MPLCGPANDIQRRSMAIERQLRKERISSRKECKILLLGTGESGKSTIIKQMRIIYGKGFDDEDRQQFTTLVYQNIISAMKSMLDALDVLDLELSDEELEGPAYDLLDIDVTTVTSLDSHLPLLKQLWAHPVIQEAFSRRNEYQLTDSAGFYFDSLDRIGASDYLPSIQDVLRARRATTGIHEFTFDLDQVVFRMMDVGGQRSERKKWIHSFEGVTSIIFISASNEYDQVCLLSVLSHIPDLISRQSGPC